MAASGRKFLKTGFRLDKCPIGVKLRAWSNRQMGPYDNMLGVVRSRTQPILPIPKLPIWKKDGKLFFVDRVDLECAMEAAAIPDGLIRMRMGRGYHYISDALGGA